VAVQELGQGGGVAQAPDLGFVQGSFELLRKQAR